MKNILIYLLGMMLVAIPSFTFAQVTTANNAPNNAASYVGLANGQNYPLQIRHNGNQPINTFTNNIIRMRLNQSLNYVVNNGNNLPRNGYLLIGQNTPIITQGNTPIYNNGAFSLLHLNGDASALAGGIDPLGHRDWMKTGVTFTGNGDLSYIGLREAGNDVTETVIAWADDGVGAAGPDDLVLRFLGGANANAANSSNLSTPFDGDGAQIARFVPSGQVGIGNTFDATTRPQNLMHMSIDGNNAVFTQLTNQTGTGQTATDGLRLGYPLTSAANLEARIEQQENDRVTLFSNAGERLRIMHLGALNNGVTFNPGALAPNLTRIGISHNPATPVTRPLSLLHLGYNVDNASNNDGWRSWMDVGIFTSRATDHLYIGMKDEPNGSDAVLSWGDNNLADGAGPDNFRLIFTTPIGVGLGPGNTTNGLEGMRMSPTFDLNNANVGIKTGIGGDPAANTYFGGGANPTATLEVNAWGSSPTTANGAPADPIIGGTPTGLSGLRLTDLRSNSTPQLNPGQGVLSVDAEGDVVYVPASTGNVSACATPVPNFITKWTTANEICNTIMYEDAATRIGVSTTTPSAKFHVNNTTENLGVYGITTTTPTQNANLGVRGSAENGNQFNVGVYGTSPNNITFPGIPVLNFTAGGPLVAAIPCNTGVAGSAQGSVFNIGGAFQANTYNQNCTANIGIYASAIKCDTTPAIAGFFRGDILYTAGLTSVSDKQFKDNIQPIKSAVATLSALNPTTYVYNTSKFPNMGLPSGNGYGLIAQELEKVLPELVQTAISPQIADVNGKIIQDTIQFKSVNYVGLIPLTIAALQEQQTELDTRNAVIQDLQSRLTQLEACINNLQLCSNTMQKNAPENNPTGDDSNATSNSKLSAQYINLADPQTLVLNQNVPNPFAERTSITYYLSKEVKSAKIVFHNQDGKFVNSVELTERGNGLLNVYADDLSSGVYTYTLIADEKVIDTKRMIKQ